MTNEISYITTEGRIIFIAPANFGNLSRDVPKLSRWAKCGGAFVRAIQSCARALRALRV